jgi:hypothetical protein
MNKKSKPKKTNEADAEMKTRSNSVDEFIRRHTSSDPHKLPADFKKILAEEINLLHLPAPTPEYPFAVNTHYIQTGTGIGEYLFNDLDYAVLRFVFGVAEPGKLEKAALKDWMLNKCGVSLSELKELSRPDISRRFLSALVSTQKKESEKPAETDQKTKKIVSAFLISLLIICAFILSVWLIPFTPFTWLRNHPNSYGIQGSIICLIPCLVFAIFKPGWRKWCLGVAGLAFLGVLLSLLGGRSSR